MPGLPVAQLVSTDREPGLARYDALCPYCNRVHHHQWLGDDAAFAVTAPCDGTQRYRVKLPDRDDQAINEYIPNWEE